MEGRARKTEDDDALLLFPSEQTASLAREPSRSAEIHLHDGLDPSLEGPIWDRRSIPRLPPSRARRRPTVLPWVLVGLALGAVLWINRDIFETLQTAPPRGLSQADTGPRTFSLPPDSVADARPEPVAPVASSSERPGPLPAPEPSSPSPRTAAPMPLPTPVPARDAGGSVEDPALARAGTAGTTSAGAAAPQPVSSTPSVSTPPRAEGVSRVETPAPVNPSREMAATAAAPASITPAAGVPRAAPNEAVAATRAAEAAVLDAVRRYEAAYDRLDARAAAAVWPSVDERALGRAFSGLASQGLTLDRCEVLVESVSATARCQGSISYVGRVGGSRPATAEREWTFRLRKAGNDWLIDEVVSAQMSQ